MSEWPRPRIVASRCLGFASCRFNGQVIRNDLIERLRAHVEFVTPCPEVEIGLGVPRDPVRVVSTGGEKRLMQPATGRDLTAEMNEFAERFLDGLGPADGFILKSRSPSCGPTNVQVYHGAKDAGKAGRASGFFAAAAARRYPHHAFEEEGRLRNADIREHFLASVFASARFRRAVEAGRMGALVAFHSAHKLLVMARDQSGLVELGRIVANHQRRPFPEVAARYEPRFRMALARVPRRGRNANVLTHAMGHFSDRLEPPEKSFFLGTLEDYRAGRVPLSVPVYVVRGWAVRWNEGYVLGQTFFRPFPDELAETSDTGRGRDIWRRRTSADR
jgi:uncharacterized protein YbgA (DUF1722 family)/uncharacterized protein YbbK (DUF523 family)